MTRLSLLCSIAAVIAACSPANVGSPDAGSADAGLTVAKACADEAYGRCSHLQSCTPIGVQYRYGDEPTCESLFTADCVNGQAAPSTGSTPATAEGCAQALPSWDCPDFIDNVNLPPACQTVAGTLAAGATCAFATQCASAFCAIVPGSACGVCAAAPQAGATCAELTTCGPGLFCNDVSSLCQAFALSGAACVPGQTCVVGNDCEGFNTTTGASGTCDLAAETLGATCAPSGGGCDFWQGLSCNSQSKLCVPVQLVAAGQPCGTVNDVGAACTNGGKCVGNTGGAPGACVGTAAVGAACDLAMGPGCVGPSRCVVTADGGTAGTCVIPSATLCQ